MPRPSAPPDALATASWVLVVAATAQIGALCRHAVVASCGGDQACAPFADALPNVLGSVCAGALLRARPDPFVEALLVGFCSSLTTYSAVNLGAARSWLRGQPFVALNAAVHTLALVAAVGLGRRAPPVSVAAARTPLGVRALGSAALATLLLALGAAAAQARRRPDVTIVVVAAPFAAGARRALQRALNRPSAPLGTLLCNALGSAVDALLPRLASAPWRAGLASGAAAVLSTFAGFAAELSALPTRTALAYAALSLALTQGLALALLASA